MNFTVTDNFNNKAWSGWILLLFYMMAVFVIQELTHNFVLIALLLGLNLIITVSLIGRGYWAAFVILALINILNGRTGFLSPTNIMAVNIILAFIATFIIPYVIIVFYKRMLNFFSRPYFYLNTKKLPTKTKLLRAILWLALLLLSYSAVYIPLFHATRGIEFDGDFWLSFFMVDFVVLFFPALFSAIIVGYQRIYSIIILPVFVYILHPQLFGVIMYEHGFNRNAAAYYFFITAVAVLIVIGYYGNTNKISFEKAVRFLARNCCKTKEI